MDMNETKLKALLHLLDGPGYGGVWHCLGQDYPLWQRGDTEAWTSWESTEDGSVQERIEDIIHKVNFNDVYTHFEKWNRAEKPGLLNGAFILANYRYPQIDADSIAGIKSIYQSCWLELNNYLTPLEQINIVNSIFYNMYKFKGLELEENKPTQYYLNEVVESRLGNNYSLGMVYQIICEMLDIPVSMPYNFPKQYILAYYDTLHDFFKKDKEPVHKIQFYIDPNNGMIYTQNDVDVFINKYEIMTDESTFLPLSNKAILHKNIEALVQVYQLLQEEDKVAELRKLLALYNGD